MENLIRVSMFILGGLISSVLVFRYINNIKKEVRNLKIDMKEDFKSIFKELKGLTKAVSSQILHHIEKYHPEKK